MVRRSAPHFLERRREGVLLAISAGQLTDDQRCCGVPELE